MTVSYFQGGAWIMWGGGEAHGVGRRVAEDLAVAEVHLAARDAHAASLRAQGTFPGNYFHWGHGMGRNGRQRTNCSGESGDEASRRTGTGQFQDTSSMGAMECRTGRGLTLPAVFE